MIRQFSADWTCLLRRLERLAGTREAAEDAFQSAFVRIAEYRQHSIVHRPTALLARIAVNLALDERRRARRNHAEQLDEDCGVADDTLLQDELLAARDRLHQVQFVLSRIPERTRRAFLMHRVDGLKYAQIAEQLGVSVSAVEKHIARAAFLLAEAMQDICYLP